MPTEHQQERCAAQHFGPWMIEPYWFVQAVAAVKAGTFVPVAQTGDGKPYEIDGSGIASIGIEGQMMKGESSFGGTSTVRVRREIREAAGDESVKAILLLIDSPGGTVAGTADLAADVARANEQKPVYAYIEDVGASAAYWVASQARRVTANATALVGSIGTLMVLEDTSGMADMMGVKVHAVSTGAYKGAGVPGTEITEDHLEYAQDIVDDTNAHFLRGIKRGRGMRIGDVRELADGRVHIASKAQALGLIDGVESLDETVRKMRQNIKEAEKTPRREQATVCIQLTEASIDLTVKD